jgi:hypothetical protein
MKKSYSLLFSILIIIFVGVLFYSYFLKEIIEGVKKLEGFSLDTSNISSSVSSSTSSVGYYDNLSRLSPDNVWSSSTIKSFLDYINSQLLSQQPNATPLKVDSPTFQTTLKRFQPFSTDSEVAYYIKNGEWPWNGYVTDYINNTFLPALKTQQTDDQQNAFLKMIKTSFTNRQIYINVIMNSTVPQLSIINKLNFGGLEPSVGTKMECVFLREGDQTQPDGTTKISIEKDGKYLQLNNVYTLDNNVYTSIPGFQFQSQPCNVCNITNYTDPTNNCLFTIKTPEAFDQYMGNNSLTSSTSSITSGTSSTMNSFGSVNSSNDKKDSTSSDSSNSSSSDSSNSSNSSSSSSSSSSWF